MATTVQDSGSESRQSWLAHWLKLPPRKAHHPIQRAGSEEKGIEQFVRSLVSDGRYVFALLKEAATSVDGKAAEPASEALGRHMALVPEGVVPQISSDGSLSMIEVRAFHMDRCAVTNERFSRFVEAKGYEDLELWPQEVWPSLMRFVDRTGKPGPAGWSDGRYPAGLAEHPVVGICWYEAAAYARWAGKRLPNSAEWRKAAGWPERLQGGDCLQYPWGDLFDTKRANLWCSGLGKTTPVDAFPAGDTPSGIRQLCGNVWEWIAEPLTYLVTSDERTFRSWKPMRRILGGAFDTYFPGEAASSFVTGQSELSRRPNIGFRCVVSADALREGA